ncbi:DUF4097 family beta strand repeat-containing protein [Bacillus alkalicellulosilyticus]|uniref:DUF4097 family beta strand repeat-containing protein n=1 Tax=Alkalihalobacterium alkalicellulosilyticum TaxID=1912214 RepID=UPI000996E898|nr:DUF4097 family beta strand repeat-containing protein [Bacillus alkalicellulosilyticus]
MKTYLCLLILPLLLLSGCNLVQVEEQQTVTLPAEEITALQLDLAEGNAEIIGEDGRSEIEVLATFFAYGEEEEEALAFQKENLSLELTKENETAFLRTSIYRRDQTTNDGLVHVKVYAPSSVAVQVRQHAGSLHLSHMNNSIALDHGAGAIELSQITGSIKITDGGGYINATDIFGDLQVNNASGNLSIERMKGNASLTVGKGETTVRGVAGDVTVRSGQDDITIDDVNGNVTILENYAGEIMITNVTGTITQ